MDFRPRSRECVRFLRCHCDPDPLKSGLPSCSKGDSAWNEVLAKLGQECEEPSTPADAEGADREADAPPARTTRQMQGITAAEEEAVRVGRERSSAILRSSADELA